MSFIKTAIDAVLKRFFPNFYWDRKIKKFDPSTIIYKKQSYQTFLDLAFRDFRPGISDSQRKALEHDMLRSYLKDRVRPDEYFLYHFDEKSDTERHEYLPRTPKDKLIISYYKEGWKDTLYHLRNKYEFYLLAKDFFKRDVISIGADTNNFEEFRLFCQKHPKFIAKELKGGCGVGVKLCDVNAFGSPTDLYDNLTASSSWIIEELIRQDKEISSFNASTVNTIRFPSFRHGNEVVAARPCMRFGRMGNIVDNAGQGGVFVSIDLQSGEIITDAFDEHGHRYTEHPDSHKVFKGFKVPRWDELITFARDLHLSLPADQVYVAFDFALSENSWVVVEGNWGDWVLQQVSLERGFAKEFAALLNGETL